MANLKEALCGKEFSWKQLVFGRIPMEVDPAAAISHSQKLKVQIAIPQMDGKEKMLKKTLNHAE